MLCLTREKTSSTLQREVQDGRVSFAVSGPGVMSGAGIVLVRVDGYVHVSQPVAPDQLTVTWEGLVLERGRTLRGRLVDASGRPARGSVAAWPAGPAETRGLSWLGLYEVDAGPDGRFELRVPPARVLLLARQGNRLLQPKGR